MTSPLRPVRLAPLDLLLLGLLGLRVRPGRAALSALGIAIGIATLVVVTGIPASSQRALERQLAALGTNVLEAVPANDPGTGQPAQLPSTAVDMVARIAPVTTASAVANTHAPISRTDRSTDDFSGVTVLAAWPDLVPALGLNVVSGQFLTPATEAFPTVVLGAIAAQRLGFDHVDPAAQQQVFVGHRWFTVIGILAPAPLTPDIDRAALVGRPAATTQLGFDGHPTVIYLRAYEPQIEAVRDVLPATIDPPRPGDVQVSRPSDALTAKRATEQTFSALFLGLAAVALLVGGIGVANTMVISVLERRREIGLRRALGASRGQIRTQFLTESVTLSAVGGFSGVLAGAAAVTIYAGVQHWPTTIPPATLVTGVVGAVAIGILAGVVPSVRAARLPPTTALAAP